MKKNLRTLNEGLTMAEAVRLSGVSEYTIRAWEKRYGAIRPVRTPTGRRVFLPADVHRLRMFAQLVARGHAIGKIAPLHDKDLNELLSESNPTDDTIGQAIELLRTFQFVRLRDSIRAAKERMPVSDFLKNWVAPLLRATGQLNSDGHLSVSHEHTVSALLRSELGPLLDRAHEKVRNTLPPLLFATPEDNHHEFGILISAILAGQQGFPVHFVGVHVPAKDLADFTKKVGAPVVILGALGMDLENLKKYLGDLDQELPEPVALWVGGNQSPAQWKTSRNMRWLENWEAFELALGEFGGPLPLEG